MRNQALFDARRAAWLLLPGAILLGLGFLVPISRMLMLAFSGPEGVSFAGFRRFVADSYYPLILWRTLKLSALITLVCVALGFPLAYIMARGGPRLRLSLTIVVVLPLMTSVVIRTFGWMVLLGRSGLIANALRRMGLVGRTFELIHTETAIVIGMAQVLLPFMALTVMATLLRLDVRLEEAARTMGCSFLGALRHVVLPLSAPGVLAGSLLVFTLSASSFVTPALLGGSRLETLAGSIYKNVTETPDWSFAAAQAVILLVGVGALLAGYLKIAGRRRG